MNACHWIARWNQARYSRLQIVRFRHDVGVAVGNLIKINHEKLLHPGIGDYTVHPGNDNLDKTARNYYLRSIVRF